MKYIKKFDNYLNEEIISDIVPAATNISLMIFSSIALIKTIYTIIEKKKSFKKISKEGFVEIEKLMKKNRGKKNLIGEIIDNDEISQVVYNYGGGDNTIVIILYKIEKKLKFKWSFDMPMFPFIRSTSDDEIEINLYDDEIEKIEKIFKSLKNGESKDINYLR